jgi:hypothetical protein
MRKIKLMADYFCFPLWEVSTEVFGDIDPNTLPISEKLQNQLMQWAAVYDGILNMEDPASTDFKSEDDRRAFEEEGYRLAQALQTELGENFEVITNIVI